MAEWSSDSSAAALVEKRSEVERETDNICRLHRRDRAGNERAVNVCKRTGLAKRGFQPGMSATRLNNAWRCWGFQANFMYKPTYKNSKMIICIFKSTSWTIHCLGLGED